MKTAKLFLKQLRPALMILLVMVMLCGVVYTGVITGAAQLIFPSQANGSVIEGQGSALLAREFTEPKYLIGRPMLVSNLGPNSEEQAKLVQARIDWWHSLDPANTADIPADLITGSGSGADPNISPAAAEYQVARVARERGMTEDAVRAIIAKYTAGRFLGFIGEPAVNVLKVNLALDGLL